MSSEAVSGEWSKGRPNIWRGAELWVSTLLFGGFLGEEGKKRIIHDHKQISSVKSEMPLSVIMLSGVRFLSELLLHRSTFNSFSFLILHESNLAG